MIFPKRAIPLEFLLDSNRINALCKIHSMNILWTLYERGVIDLNIPDIAQREASKGSAARFSKAIQIISTTTLNDYRQRKDFRKIKDILFPNGFTPGKEKNQENDVLIVLHAKIENTPLITNDGGSRRQPGGMLGNKDRLLKHINVEVVRDNEALARVRDKIEERDKRARWVAGIIKKELPDWVDKDLGIIKAPNQAMNSD